MVHEDILPEKCIEIPAAEFSNSFLERWLFNAQSITYSTCSISVRELLIHDINNPYTTFFRKDVADYLSTHIISEYTFSDLLQPLDEDEELGFEHIGSVLRFRT